MNELRNGHAVLEARAEIWRERYFEQRLATYWLALYSTITTGALSLIGLWTLISLISAIH